MHFQGEIVVFPALMYAGDVFHSHPRHFDRERGSEERGIQTDRHTYAPQCLHGFILDPFPPPVARNTGAQFVAVVAVKNLAENFAKF